MTYSELQNVEQDGAERHQIKIESGISKLYATGGAIFASFDVEEMLEGSEDASLQLAASALEIYS